MWPNLFQQLIRRVQSLPQQVRAIPQAVQYSFNPPPRLTVPTNIQARPQTRIQQALREQPRQAIPSAQIRPAPQPSVAGVSIVPTPTPTPIPTPTPTPPAQTYSPDYFNQNIIPGTQGLQNLQQTVPPEVSADQLITSTYQDLMNEANTRFREYQSKYPFVYDEILKQKTKEAIEQQGIGPEAPETTYYNERLSDYLLGIDRRKGRGIQTANQLLQELQRQSQGFGEDTQLRLQQALNRARSGYADIGLGSSGERYGAEGALIAAQQQSMADYLGGQQLREAGYGQELSRLLQDLSLQKQQDVRELYRQSGEATKTLAGQLTKEAGQKYVTGFQGTLPPQLQGQQSSLDLLKNIGIYQ